MPRYQIILRDIREYQFVVEADSEQEARKIAEQEPVDNDYVEISVRRTFDKPLFDAAFNAWPVADQIEYVRSLIRDPELAKRLYNDSQFYKWLVANKNALLALRD